jgi:hypothetical protein
VTAGTTVEGTGENANGQGQGAQDRRPYSEEEVLPQKTRCIKCPVVIMRMKKIEHEDLSKKELKQRLEKARAA